MEFIKNWNGLEWRIYNEYKITNIGSKDYIIPVFSNGIRKSYNPNIDDTRPLSNRRNNLFLEFAKIDQENNDEIINLINQYGLLWTEKHSIKKGEISGDPLSDFKDEIFALKKALDIYRALKSRKIGKLYDLIKFKKRQAVFSNLHKAYKVEFGDNTEKQDLSSKNIKSAKEISEDSDDNYFIINAGIKNEPVIEIEIEKNKEKELAAFMPAAYLYLIELISDRINRSRGAIPYYIKITESEKNILGYSMLPTFECNNLAAALWIQFYNIINKNQEIAECAFCGLPFVKEGRSLYCNKICKNNKNVSDYRKRVKALKNVNKLNH
ncbi:MAG: hypothetical protein M1326_09125 [Cyanobacteria bacterium]|nr:hypothetical protein [Cyanobacteriota bacterium]